MADKIAVGSSVYNLAGDEANRPDFLKSLIFGGVLSHADSLGQVITQGYRNGPRVKFRRFMKWAKSDADFTGKVGLSQASLEGYQQLDLQVIKDNIPPPPGEFVDHVEMARISEAEVSYWVLQYLAVQHPDDEFGTASSYSYEYDKDAGTVTITFADAHQETFAVSGFVSGARYLYARYVPAAPESVGPTSWDLLYTTLPEGTPFPDVSGHQVDSQTTSEFTASLGYRQKRLTTYSDGRPPSEVVTETFKSQTITQANTIYFQDVFMGQGPGTADSVYSERRWLEADLTYFVSDWIPDDQVKTSSEVIDGVTYTYKTTGEYQTFLPLRKTKNGLSEVIHKAWTFPLYFIYQEGTGNAALDALFPAAGDAVPDGFYPPIPFRYENKAVGPEGTGEEQWWINIGAFLDTANQFVQVRGGPVVGLDDLGNERFIELDVLDMSPDSSFVWKVQNKAGYTTDLSQVLLAPNCEFRILTDGSISPSGQTELTDWIPLLSAPEPTGTNAALVDIYPSCKRAFRKAFGTNYDQVQDTVLNNEKIRDIDHVLTVFGVSLNVQEVACRKYVYKFFQNLANTAPGFDAAEEANWFAAWQAADAAEATHASWRSTHHPGGIPKQKEPPRGAYPEIPWQTLKLETVHAGVSDYRVDLKWAFLHETTGIGTPPGHSDAEEGDLWFEVLADPIAEYRDVDEDNPDGFNQQIAMFWQDSASTWRKLTITGLQHVNHVYKDMKIVTTAKKALETVNTDSPFIVPLRESLYDAMSVVDATQMATACAFLVFNCYEVKAEEWYETTAFKVILIVAIIAVAVSVALISGGTSLGVAGGAIYGITTGAGLSVTAAIVLGVIVDVLVGLLVSFVLSQASIALFGDKWGPLIGVILTSILFLGLGALVGGYSLADLLASPDTWMAIGMATTNGVSEFLNASAREVAEDTARMMEETGARNAEVQRMYNETFGASRIDPSLADKYISELTERPEQFLQRTLMTGSDIVELTLRSVSHFVQDRLRLELP